MEIQNIPNANLNNLNHTPQLGGDWEPMVQRLKTLMPMMGEKKAFETVTKEFFTSQQFTPTEEFAEKFTQGLRLAAYELLNSDPLMTLPIKSNIIGNLEHGPIGKVQALVLHQTNSSTAKSTLNTWKTRPYGTHFLIDKDGTTYQTARLTKQTLHVGKIKSRCKEEQSCSESETKTINQLRQKNSFGTYTRKLYHHELKKNYPNRFPINKDSIGIEVVELFDEKKGYGPPTKEQKIALDLLVNALLIKYDLTLKDVYAHATISRKQKSEAIHLGY